MAKTAAEILIDTLMDWAVEVVFGLPGDGIDCQINKNCAAE
jgi:pyruvate dehydrogenase (quinone)